MDITLFCIYEGEGLTEPTNPSDFCSKYTRQNPIILHSCNECHRQWEKIAKEQKHPVIFECDTGLANFFIPVMVDDIYVASLLGGQVLLEPKEDEYFAQLAGKLGFDTEEYVAAAKKLKVISIEKLKGMTDLLFLVTNSLCSIAYANKKLVDLGLDYRVIKNIAIEEWFTSNYMNTKKKKVITEREHQILKLVTEGKSNTEIAKELYISVHTVKAHVSTILEKLGVEDRVQVSVKAVKEGII